MSTSSPGAALPRPADPAVGAIAARALSDIRLRVDFRALDLPLYKTSRWTARRKAAVADAILRKQVSVEAVCEHYRLEDQEVRAWCAGAERHGPGSLPPRLSPAAARGSPAPTRTPSARASGSPCPCTLASSSFGSMATCRRSSRSTPASRSSRGSRERKADDLAGHPPTARRRRRLRLRLRGPGGWWVTPLGAWGHDAWLVVAGLCLILAELLAEAVEHRALAEAAPEDLTWLIEPAMAC